MALRFDRDLKIQLTHHLDQLPAQPTIAEAKEFRDLVAELIEEHTGLPDHIAGDVVQQCDSFPAEQPEDDE